MAPSSSLSSSSILWFLLSLQLISLPSLGKITINNELFDICQWGLLNYPSNETLQLVSPNYGNLTGKIVYIISPGAAVSWKDFNPIIKSLQDNGCIGVIAYPYNTRQIGFTKYGQISNEGFVLPVGMISINAYQYIIQQNEEVLNFTYFEWDPNPWDFMFTGPNYIAVQVIMIALYSLNVIISTYLLSCWFYSIGKFELTLGISCLVIEWFCNALRVIQSSLYPIYNVYHLPNVDVITSVATCLSLISSLLVVFFWLDLTTDHFYHGKFLGIMKKPALIFITLCMLFEILESIIRTQISPGVIAQVVAIIYLLLQSIISIFYFVAAKKICGARKDKSLVRVSIHIILSGISTLLSWVFLGLFLSPAINQPVGYVVVWTMLFISFFAQSFFLIVAFQVPKRKKQNTSSYGSGSSPSTNTLSGGDNTTREEKEMTETTQ